MLYFLLFILQFWPGFTVPATPITAWSSWNGFSLQYVNTSPKPTFYFCIAYPYRGFKSAFFGWGPSSNFKDGISIKPSINGGYIISDAYKTTSTQTDPYSWNSNIFSATYNSNDGKLSFLRAWDTSDKSYDVPLKQGQTNSFVFEVEIGMAKYSISFTADFVEVKEIDEPSDDRIGWTKSDDDLKMNWR